MQHFARLCHFVVSTSNKTNGVVRVVLFCEGQSTFNCLLRLVFSLRRIVSTTKTGVIQQDKERFKNCALKTGD